jgi:hypothetical protein
VVVSHVKTFMAKEKKKRKKIAADYFHVKTKSQESRPRKKIKRVASTYICI